MIDADQGRHGQDSLVVRTDAAIQEAAAGMRDSGVGSLPVMDKSDELAGIVTDRDIAVRAVAEALGAETHVERVMTRRLIVVEPSDKSTMRSPSCGSTR